MSEREETKSSIALWTFVLIGVAAIGAAAWSAMHRPPSPDRGQDDRVFCETYCESAGGALVQMENARRTAIPVCTCLFADPD